MRNQVRRAPGPASATASVAAAIEARLHLAMARDASRLGRRIERARSQRADEPEWTRLAAELERSIARCQARAAVKPAFTYPADLPVAQRADELVRAIREHPVVIVCGETGSGKTTQLPKICLAAGRGERGLIGHTQPRRIAARAVAARIAQELGQAVGEAVGYKVRFTDQTRPDAYIKLMTDGILLAETQGDRLLEAYDTIIVDEAHERSLNIDFLLGYLSQLLRKRPDLKVVITSATLDAERFARHFAAGGKPAPVIEVSGRVFPVDVRFRPLRKASGPGKAALPDEADDEEDLEEAIVATAEELWREAPGDILVFLPGEREIRETGDLLRRGLARRPYAAQIEILPLFARLSVAEQQRIFAPGNGRRIVLATNVAETSITVPGIRYVIDTGLARVKRYSVRNKTTLLQIEKVSQSSANQRAGRCGRVADGICVRLYGEEDFAARPKFTDPEILRSSLAAVILRMASLDLGAVDAFPFVEAPGARAIADGYQLLQELGAVDDGRLLTPLGRELARLPLDPRIGRIVLAARDLGCLPEALVIASALAVPDPRERPLERQQAADQAHLRFRDDRSDFLSLVALWEFFGDAMGQKLSHRRLVDACRAQFVSWLRLREWRDVHQQLVAALQEAGWKWAPGKASAHAATNGSAAPGTPDAARYATLHKAVLAGLLGNIGVKADTEEYYLGARGLRFHLHPGSGLAKKGGAGAARGGTAKWLLAAELTETSRLFARCAAKVEPEWIEEVAGDRVTRDHFEPHWEEKRGEVIASERVSLYGLTLVARRPVSFGSIDPKSAREVFIREALVPGALATRGSFLVHNKRLVAEVAELEHKARRQDVLVDDETIAAFYAERLPPHIHSLVAFERWRADAEASDPRVLYLTRDYLMRHAASQVTAELFPGALDLAGTKLSLKYRFSPGHPLDGLTLTAPLSLLNQLDDGRLSWLVPGMVREKVTHYLKSLPKAWRNRLIPLPEVVTAFLESSFGSNAASSPAHPVTPLPQALRGYLRERLGESPPVDVWDGVDMPAHLIVNVRVVDAAGGELAMGRDLAQLRGQLGEAAQMSFAAGGPAFEKKGLRRWDFGDLPETLAIGRGTQRLTGFPALVDEGDSVAMAMLDTRDAAEASTRAGVLRLLRIALKDAVARFEKGGPEFAQSALLLKTTIATDRLLADVLAAVTDRAFLGEDPIPRSERAFADQVKRARTRLAAVAEGAFRLLAEIADEHAALAQRLGRLPAAQSRLAAEVRAQRDALVHPGFFAGTPWTRLSHIPRYLRALDRRLAKYGERPERDKKHAEQVAVLWDRYRARRDSNAQAGRAEPALDDFRWLLEELRVSLFAQELKTPVPVSFKRVERAWTDLTR
ncbi:MAG TPA: ATP-dependent RNA helicase HrpA [Casimicrobiaceae bacterium]|nr:ATP-dependent RNA helicase HrpA [Casimicrobiaceae bacterium]